MKPLVLHWQFGVQLLVRLAIMLFCIAAGPALLLAAQFILVSEGVILPAPIILLAQLTGFFVVGPLLLAAYAKYCGYRSDVAQAQSTI